MTDGFSYPTDEFILIGKVTKAHGIKGELKLIAFSGQPESITRHEALILVSRQGQLTPALNVVRSRAGNRNVIVQFEGVSNRNDAEKLSGYGVLLHKKDLPALGDDEFYLYELEGLQVLTEEKEVIGNVESFFSNGMQDILVVRDGKKEFLIPLIPGLIRERNESRMIIAPPPGLLDINTGDSAEGEDPHDI
ncbi:MAG TPA: 16S rRNA processing protein RimM [Desulfobacterales bacterium]|nr:16S rRNA processing protein RimM [Desulfobacterales bacterium]HIP38132.1 16S rRNA processing protein RimM [Desulfocapsa sulfexigens]